MALSLRTRTPGAIGLSCPQPEHDHPARWVCFLAPRLCAVLPSLPWLVFLSFFSFWSSTAHISMWETPAAAPAATPVSVLSW